jgi:hypothetical protein
MNGITKMTISASLAMAAMVMLSRAPPVAATPLFGPNLTTFTVLGASTVTNVPPSVITGNVGVWSSGGANAITGFLSSPGAAVPDPQVLGGLVHAGTTSGFPNAKSAQEELSIAIAQLGSLGAGILLPSDLTGLNLAPGIYTVPAGASNLSGSLTLDGQGNANAAWIFQMPSTFITSTGSSVNLINSGLGAGVYWNIGSSATIASDTSFIGNLLALASISFGAGATDLCGRALADTGAVTLIQNQLSSSCVGNLLGSNGLGGGLDVTTDANGLAQVSMLPFAAVSGGSVPEPGMLALMILGMGPLWLLRIRHA